MLEDGTASIYDPLPPLQECSSYNYTGGLRTGCDIRTKVTQGITILLNGTANGTFFRNTYHKTLKDDGEYGMDPLVLVLCLHCWGKKSVEICLTHPHLLSLVRRSWYLTLCVCVCLQFSGNIKEILL